MITHIDPPFCFSLLPPNLSISALLFRQSEAGFPQRIRPQGRDQDHQQRVLGQSNYDVEEGGTRDCGDEVVPARSCPQSIRCIRDFQIPVRENRISIIYIYEAIEIDR